MTWWRHALRRRGVQAGLAGVVVLGWLASGIYMVAPTSVAVQRLFGAVTDGAVPPGVHWWWPWPIGQVDKAEVTRTFSMALGFRAVKDGEAPTFDPVESRWLTGDTNILHLRSKVGWRIADPAGYLFRVDDPERMLRSIVGTAFTDTMGTLPVDDVLTTGRLVLREQVRGRAQAMLDAWGVGVQILSVNLEAVDPPSVVVKAFQDVQNARADRERLVSDAESYANTTIPLARGEAEKAQHEAEAFRVERLQAAEADADRFRRLVVEHDRAPGLLEKRLYLETVERVLPRVRRYVLEPGNEQSIPIRILE
jgi:modulator of FtsH protease HflK